MSQPNKTANIVRVAAIQAGIGRPDLAAAVSKTLALIEEAASAGAKLVCFGETWLPGYPAWLDYCRDAALWNQPQVKDIYAELRANSVTVPGPETALIAELAGRLNVGVVIGVNERVTEGPGHGTLYNSILTFGSDG